EEQLRPSRRCGGQGVGGGTPPDPARGNRTPVRRRGGGARGYVLSRPDEDRYLITQSELESRIKVALGGTVAEELVFGEISNGATNDLEQASRIARAMVKEFGMSRLGRVCFQEHDAGFLAGTHDGQGERYYSEETAREIDQEVAKILEEATREVRGIL